MGHDDDRHGDLAGEAPGGPAQGELPEPAESVAAEDEQGGDARLGAQHGDRITLDEVFDDREVRGDLAGDEPHVPELLAGQAEQALLGVDADDRASRIAPAGDHHPVHQPESDAAVPGLGGSPADGGPGPSSERHAHHDVGARPRLGAAGSGSPTAGAETIGFRHGPPPRPSEGHAPQPPTARAGGPEEVPVSTPRA